MTDPWLVYTVILLTDAVFTAAALATVFRRAWRSDRVAVPVQREGADR